MHSIDQVIDDSRRKFVLKGGTKVCDFVLSNKEVDIIEGPIGSGKTRALCARIMRHAQEQHVSKIEGVRLSRWAMIRNTYPDLRRTTIRTWLEMFPEVTYGRFNWGQPPFHKIRFNDVYLEVDFLALDKAEDIGKLRSTEYTGIAWNELSFIFEKELFDESHSRLRYPGKDHGGSAWHGVIADLNAPDEEHWLALMTGQVDLPPNLTEDERAEYEWPPHWGFYEQPPAVLERIGSGGQVLGYDVNPQSENIENLPEGYYAKMIHGKKKSWIDSRLRNVCVLVVEGSPVFPMFRKELHISNQALRPAKNTALEVGLDFGRQPAAIFGQQIGNRVFFQYELLGLNEGAVTFAPKVARFIAKHYPEHRLSEVKFWGDPKGEDKGQNDDKNAYEIFGENGMKVRAAPNLKQNMISTRVDAVTSLLTTLDVEGRPRGVYSPMCRTLNVGMQGRYHLIREEDGELRPNKNRYSNPNDAHQYLTLGMGEGAALTGRPRPGSYTQPVRVYRGRQSMRRVAG
jgi:hypothetical protein